MQTISLNVEMAYSAGNHNVFAFSPLCRMLKLEDPHINRTILHGNKPTNNRKADTN